MENINLLSSKPGQLFKRHFMSISSRANLSVALFLQNWLSSPINSALRSVTNLLTLGVTMLLLGCQAGPLPWDTKVQSQSPKNTVHLEIVKPKSISAGKDNFIASNGDEVLAWGNNYGRKSEAPKIAATVLGYSAGLNDALYLLTMEEYYLNPIN